MKIVFFIGLGLAIIMGGCSSKSAAEHHSSIIKNELLFLDEPKKLLSNYGKFELKEMFVSSSLLERKEKAEAIKELETRLVGKVTPLLDSWNKLSEGKEGTLYIIPKLYDLRIISGLTRAFIGQMAGGSKITMYLKLVDAKTGEVVGNPKLALSSDARMGYFSMGATDRNLLEYIADISYEYLKNNYEVNSTK